MVWSDVWSYAELDYKYSCLLLIGLSCQMVIYSPSLAGFTGNGHQCNDINECEVMNGGCSINPMVECINTIGSRT